MPPSQAGIVPAALPAFSAPKGVSVVPSLARSADDSSAEAFSATAAPTPSASRVLVVLKAMESLLERVADAERIEVAVLERVRGRAEARRLSRRYRAGRGAHVGAAIDAATLVAGVLQVHQPLALVIPGHAERIRANALVEVRPDSFHVLGPRHARRKRAAVERVGVFQASHQAIAP